MKVFLAVAMLTINFSAFSANELKCKVDDLGKKDDSKEVAPVIFEDGIGEEDNVVEFKESEFSATYDLGRKQDSQTSLKLKFDDLTSTTYDVSESSSFNLEKDELRFQCWFEKKEEKEEEEEKGK